MQNPNFAPVTKVLCFPLSSELVLELKSPFLNTIASLRELGWFSSGLAHCSLGPQPDALEVSRDMVQEGPKVSGCFNTSIAASCRGFGFDLTRSAQRFAKSFLTSAGFALWDCRLKYIAARLRIEAFSHEPNISS